MRKFLDRCCLPESELDNHWWRYCYEAVDPELIDPRNQRADRNQQDADCDRRGGSVVAREQGRSPGWPDNLCGADASIERAHRRAISPRTALTHASSMAAIMSIPSSTIRRPKQQIKMCLNPEAVEVAKQARADISKTCCVNGKKSCALSTGAAITGSRKMPRRCRCGWSRPICCSTRRRHSASRCAVIADESFWQRGLRGIEQVEVEVPLASLLPEQAARLRSRD